MAEMKLIQIVTWKADVPEDDPWCAFLFEPEKEGQTPEDYFAEYCGHLDDTGKLKFGKTELECIQKIFKEPEIKKSVEIFSKNSIFGG